jgi:hypothetical protein
MRDTKLCDPSEPSSPNGHKARLSRKARRGAILPARPKASSFVPPKLFHVSEQNGLREFHPRPAPTPSPGLEEPVVWAVDEPHLPNYLLPRECPRVCFGPAPDMTPHDAQRFFPGRGPRRTVAVEEAWHDRIAACRLALYELPPQAFGLHDLDAGYWISFVRVTAMREIAIDDAPAELARRGANLIFLPSLWPLFDAVTQSSVSYSAIRMRNAQARTNP